MLIHCASTYAIHLELTGDLGVNSFIQAFRRFSSRRGLPLILISDNAKTSKASSKEIVKIGKSQEVHVKIVKSQEVQRYLSNKRVTWKFREGPMVGRLLGETDPKREKIHQENNKKDVFKLR